MTICQELRCKKQESKDDIGTLCKFHAEKLDKQEFPESFGFAGRRYTIGSLMTFKTINKKNAVWEDGHEHIRSIPTSTVNAWITNTIKKKKTLEDMLKLVQEQMKVTDEELEKHQKTKNSRLVVSDYYGKA